MSQEIPYLKIHLYTSNTYNVQAMKYLQKTLPPDLLVAASRLDGSLTLFLLKYELHVLFLLLLGLLESEGVVFLLLVFGTRAVVRGCR